ncbi:MAG: ABC transporter ATP-binding protein, partial [Lentisphaeraceae bacterium]|nr:ABC transporter ATP-binding protein [Lentisphaeraceae bacterium]
PQENRHFSKTIRENIEQVIEQGKNVDKQSIDFDDAYEISQLKGDIADFNQGLDTMLGEHGINLSGGQRQRLSILRALVKPREFLLMDDFVSAVDHKTENLIIDALFKHLHGETLLFISHRVSALIPCDEILVMENGRIVEHGTHEELLEKNESYRHTYEHQMIEHELEDIKRGK